MLPSELKRDANGVPRHVSGGRFVKEDEALGDAFSRGGQRRELSQDDRTPRGIASTEIYKYQHQSSSSSSSAPPPAQGGLTLKKRPNSPPLTMKPRAEVEARRDDSRSRDRVKSKLSGSHESESASSVSLKRPGEPARRPSERDGDGAR